MNEHTPRPTRAKPITVEGVTFYCFQIGIGARYEWRSQDGRYAAGNHLHRVTFYAIREGQSLQKHFRKLENALRAAVKG